MTPATRLFLCAALFLWMTPLAAALSMREREERRRLRGLVALVLGDLRLEALEQGVERRLGVPVAQPLLGGQADALLLLLDVGHGIPSKS